MLAIKVLLVDDHALLRETLAAYFGQNPSLTVVGTATNADEAIELAIEHSPRVIVMDIDMPGLNSFAAAETIRSRRPEVRFLFLSAHTRDHYIEGALRVGALGYLTKGEAPERIVAAIRDVAADVAVFSDSVLARIVYDGVAPRLAGQAKSRASSLTRREIEVLRYLARSLTKKEIANVMHLSVKTVENHTTHLMAKLDIHDRVELARFAIREGICEA